MTWCVELGLIALVATAAAASGVPAPVAEKVRAGIAERWNVPPDSIRLEFGASRRTLDPAAEPRLEGRGANGWFVVLVRATDGTNEAIRVRAGIERLEPVAARPLARGHALAERDIAWSPRVRWGVAPEAAVVRAGWRTARPLAPGDRLAAPAVAEAPLVVAGEPVRVRWERGAVRLSFDAVALSDARAGERVRVRTTARPGALEARAVAPGEARLDLEVRR